MLDFNDARLTLVSALAWRVVAELFRRHRAHHELTMHQDDPGASVRGRLLVTVDLERAGRGPCLALNLGGGIAGTWQIIRRFDAIAASDVGRRQDFASGLLGARPASVIDEIERAWGLPSRRGALPPGDASTLTTRVIAALLERRIADSHAWRTTAGTADSAMGALQATWPVLLADESLGASDALADRFVLLHRTDAEACVYSQSDVADRAWLFDLGRGRVMSVSQGMVGEPAMLQVAYQQARRDISKLVLKVEGGLDV